MASSYSFRGNAGCEASCGTELLAEIRHFWASQLHIERPIGAAARTSKDVLDKGSLRRAHFVVVREWPKTDCREDAP
jgi:hypothetical protein